MAERKSLSKKIRFEVFKRDSFTCQYCGSKAPDVVLEVDHIKPVKDGGKNDLMNLITSCFECNRGKSDKRISDKSVVEKQRMQIEELNIRRQQLEMMLEWRDGIKSLECEQHDRVIKYWKDKSGWNLTDTGEKNIKTLVDKYGVIAVMDAIDISINKYGVDSEDEIENSFSKIGGILYLKDKPDHHRKISYIKGICRNKFGYFDERKASVSLKEFYEKGYCLDQLQELLQTGEIRNWTQFMGWIKSV